MKTFIKIAFIAFLVSISYGFYLGQYDAKGNKIIGISVLFLAFILMPTFIYYRYTKGKFEKYKIENQNLTPKKKLDEKDK